MKTLFAALALAASVVAPASAQEIQQSKLLVNPSAMAQHNAQMTRSHNTCNPKANAVQGPDGRIVACEHDAWIRQSQFFDVSSEGN